MTRTTITQALTAAAIFFATLTTADAGDDFLAAARSGDVAQVQTLLADGADVEVRDASGNSALHYAAAFGYTEMAQTLVAAGAGADVDARGRIDNTPLHLAAQEGHSDVATLLIDNGADLSATNEFGGTAGTFASGWGHFDIAQQVAHDSNRPSVWFAIATVAAIAIVDVRS